MVAFEGFHVLSILYLSPPQEQGKAFVVHSRPGQGGLFFAPIEMHHQVNRGRYRKMQKVVCRIRACRNFFIILQNQSNT
jgi:hypothetical protein